MNRNLVEYAAAEANNKSRTIIEPTVRIGRNKGVNWKKIYIGDI